MNHRDRFDDLDSKIATQTPEGLFEDVRFVVAGADIAVANLESPLSVRPQVTTGEQLIGNPGSARLLGAVGFDAMGIANNHAGDAGSESVADTIAALEAAAVLPIGGDGEAVFMRPNAMWAPEYFFLANLPMSQSYSSIMSSSSSNAW